MRRAILHLVFVSLVSLTLVGCADEVVPTRPEATARSNASTPLPGVQLPKAS